LQCHDYFLCIDAEMPSQWADLQFFQTSITWQKKTPLSWIACQPKLCSCCQKVLAHLGIQKHKADFYCQSPSLQSRINSEISPVRGKETCYSALDELFDRMSSAKLLPCPESIKRLAGDPEHPEDQTCRCWI